MTRKAETVVNTPLRIAFVALALWTLFGITSGLADWVTTLGNDLRHIQTSALEARIAAARDGSLTVEPWAVPAVHRFVAALRPACASAGFLGVRAAYVSARDPAATIEAGRIIMLDLFPAVDCAPLPWALFEDLQTRTTDPLLQPVLARLAGVELLLIDGMDREGLDAVLSRQLQTDPLDKLVLLKSLGAREHILTTPRIVAAARVGKEPHAELAALVR